MFFGKFRFDEKNGAVIGPDGSAVELKRHAQGILRCLAEANGGLVSKEILLDEVWPSVTVSEDSLYQAVAELRRALGESGLIETVPRKGYRLRVRSKPRRAPVRLRWFFGAAGLVLGALIVTFAGWVVPGETHEFTTPHDQEQGAK